ncbi:MULTISPECIES: hypothetical protein [unclassified Microcoleus]|nr:MULTISPECIES: hypothetical protein [unclassified Microcoleus]
MSNCDSDSHLEDIQAAIAPNEAGHDRDLNSDRIKSLHPLFLCALCALCG